MKWCFFFLIFSFGLSIILLVAFVLFLEREKNFETKKTFEDEEGNETSSFFFR